jgi:hypothetical protein
LILFLHTPGRHGQSAHFPDRAEDHPIISGRLAPLGNDDWSRAILVFYVLPLVQTDISEVILRNKLHSGEF